MVRKSSKIHGGRLEACVQGQACLNEKVRKKSDAVATAGGKLGGGWQNGEDGK